MIGAVRFILRMIVKNGSPSEAAEAEEHLSYLDKFDGMPRHSVQDLINRHPTRHLVETVRGETVRGIVTDTKDIRINSETSEEFIERSAKDLDALGKGVGIK